MVLTDTSNLLHSAGGNNGHEADAHDAAIDIDAITGPPRSLTLEEMDELSTLLRDTLHFTNASCPIQAEDDALDVIAFVIDLLDHGGNDGDHDDEEEHGGGGSTIGQVMEELEYAEMDICGPESIDQMRLVLANYLSQLNGGEKVPIEHHESTDGAEEGAATASTASSEGAGKGKVVARRRLSRRNSYQSKLRESEQHINVDLSAKNYARRRRASLEKLRVGSTLKDRLKMFTASGELRPSWVNPGTEEEQALLDDRSTRSSSSIPPLDSSLTLAEQRQAQLESIIQDTSLSEKEQTQRLKEVQAEFAILEMESRMVRASKRRGSYRDVVKKAQGRRGSVDLCRRVHLKDRMDLLDSEYHHKIHMEQAELRKQELNQIINDRSLSRDEKELKMDEVRAKYTELVRDTSSSTTASSSSKEDEIANKWKVSKHHSPIDSEFESSEYTMETASTTKDGMSIDLSTAPKSFQMYRPRRSSMESTGASTIESNDASTMEAIISDKDRIIKSLQRQVADLSATCITLRKDGQRKDESLQELQDLYDTAEEMITELRRQKSASAPSSPVEIIASVQAPQYGPLPPFLPTLLCSSCGTNNPSTSASNGDGNSSKNRRFSRRASNCPTFSNELRRASSVAGDINTQMHEEAKIEIMALEERLKAMDGEKAELLQELKTMKTILAETSADSSQDQQQPEEKKRERLVYQLSCRKCNVRTNFIGTTDKSLRETVEKHFDHVVRAVKGNTSKKKSKSGSSDSDEECSISSGGKQQDWATEFANHFAKHCSKKGLNKFKTVKEEDVIKFCQENVKVELLKRSDGSELYWEE